MGWKTKLQNIFPFNFTYYKLFFTLFQGPRGKFSQVFANIFKIFIQPPIKKRDCVYNDKE